MAGLDDNKATLVRAGTELAVAGAGALLLTFAWRADRSWSEDHMTSFFCSTGPADMRHAAVLRWLAAAFGVAMILALRPLAGRWAARSTPAHALGAAGRIGGAVVAALLVCEIALRAVHKPPPRPGEDCANVEFIRGDPTYGWAHYPSRTIQCKVAGRTIDYTTNAFEVRSRSQDDVTDPGRPSIVFTGESIAWGDGLRYDELYSTIVGDDLGVQSVNAAIGGYAPDQAYLRAVEALGRLARPLAVVTLVVPPEIDRAVDPGRRRLALAGDGAFQFVGPAPELVRTSPLLKLLGALVPYHGDDAVEITRAVLKATAKEARAHGAYPLVAFTPFNYGEPCVPGPDGVPRIVHRLFDGLDVPYIVVDIDGSWEIPRERHPDARGDRKIADAIERALREAGVVPPERVRP